MVEEAKERRRLNPAERAARKAGRQVEAEKAMKDHERAQKTFYDNRARLKAERLARETSETGLKVQQMTGATPRQSNWKPEEDRRLLELVEAGKSWVFISANLKRPAKNVRARLAAMRRQAGREPKAQ